MKKKFDRLKYFILSFEYLISKTFFYSQSRFSQILKDLFYSKLFGLKNNFDTLSGKSTSGLPIIDNELLKERNRFNSQAVFSSYYDFDQVPEVFHSIINDNKEKIEKYLGKKFVFKKPMAFRNYNIPKEFGNFDIYSNLWHQDSHDGNRMLTIFVLCHSVSLDEGPLYYLDFDSVKKNWHRLRERWSWEVWKEVINFKDQKKFTGEKGDYIIIDNSRCMHRASIPSNYRDMILINLFPKWRKNSNRSTYV